MNSRKHCQYLVVADLLKQGRRRGYGADGAKYTEEEIYRNLKLRMSEGDVHLAIKDLVDLDILIPGRKQVGDPAQCREADAYEVAENVSEWAALERAESPTSPEEIA